MRLYGQSERVFIEKQCFEEMGLKNIFQAVCGIFPIDNDFGTVKLVFFFNKKHNPGEQIIFFFEKKSAILGA